MAHPRKKPTTPSANGIPVFEHGQIAGFDLSPIFGRAQALLKDRPGLVLGIAAGAGFLLGLSVVSKLGRVLLVGAIGIGADLLQQRMKAAFLHRDELSTLDVASAS